MGSYTPPQALLGMANTFVQEQIVSVTPGAVGLLVQTPPQTAVGSGAGIAVMSSGNGGAAEYWTMWMSGALAFTPGLGTGGQVFLINTNGTLGCLSTGVNLGYTPASSNPTITSGTVYQNTTSRYVFLYIPVTYSPTTTAAATAAFALGASSTPATIFTNSEPAGVTTGRVDTLTLSIPPGWYYSVTVTNATIGTPTEVQQ